MFGGTSPPHAKGQGSRCPFPGLLHLPLFAGSSLPAMEDVIGLFLVTFALLGFFQVLSQRGESATAAPPHPCPLPPEGQPSPHVFSDPPAFSLAVFGEKAAKAEPSAQGSPPPEESPAGASPPEQGQGDGKRKLSGAGSSSPDPAPK